MRVRGVVEISGRKGRVPAGLVEDCYRASQNGLVALVLRDIPPQAVDRILDPLVPTLPLNIPGVLYIDSRETGRVREALLAAESIFVATAAFRGVVRALGVAPRLIAPVSQAGRSLCGFLRERNGHLAPPDRNGRGAPTLVPARLQAAERHQARYHGL